MNEGLVTSLNAIREISSEIYHRNARVIWHFKKANNVI